MIPFLGICAGHELLSIAYGGDQIPYARSLIRFLNITVNNGASIWSQEKLAEGAKTDIVALEIVKVLGRRVGQVSKRMTGK
jgi:anthranilate/para-aminobenzoate synthase component II